MDGPRVSLRSLRDSDFEAWRSVRSANREWLEPWEPLPEFGTPDALIGEVSLGSVQRGPFQSAYIGYWVAEEHAGRGIAPEAVVLLMRFGFETLALHRLEAAVVPRNAASRRVASKLGLRDEGTARELLQIRGTFEDHVRYAMVADEWFDRRDALAAQFLGD